MKNLLLFFIALGTIAISGCNNYFQKAATNYYDEHCTGKAERLETGQYMAFIECDTMYKGANITHLAEKAEVCFDFAPKRLAATIITKDSINPRSIITKLFK